MRKSYRFAYTGREWDPEAKAYYYRARWYKPDIARFTSADPLASGIRIPPALRIAFPFLSYQSTFAYADLGPVQMTDPSGEAPHVVVCRPGAPTPIKCSIMQGCPPRPVEQSGESCTYSCPNRYGMPVHVSYSKCPGSCPSHLVVWFDDKDNPH